MQSFYTDLINISITQNKWMRTEKPACNMRRFVFRYHIRSVISSPRWCSPVRSSAHSLSLCLFNPLLSCMEAHIPVFWLSAESPLSWSSVLSRCCPSRLFPFIITRALLLRIPVNLTSVLRLSHWRRRFFFLLYWLAGNTALQGVTSGLPTIQSDLMFSFQHFYCWYIQNNI